MNHMDDITYEYALNLADELLVEGVGTTNPRLTENLDLIDKSFFEKEATPLLADVREAEITELIEMYEIGLKTILEMDEKTFSDFINIMRVTYAEGNPIHQMGGLFPEDE